MGDEGILIFIQGFPLLLQGCGAIITGRQETSKVQLLLVDMLLVLQDHRCPLLQLSVTGLGQVFRAAPPIISTLEPMVWREP